MILNLKKITVVSIAALILLGSSADASGMTSKSHSVDPNGPYGMLKKHVAQGETDKAIEILQSNPMMGYECQPKDLSPLLLAYRLNNTDMINILLNYGSDDFVINLVKSFPVKDLVSLYKMLRYQDSRLKLAYHGDFQVLMNEVISTDDFQCLDAFLNLNTPPIEKMVYGFNEYGCFENGCVNLLREKILSSSGEDRTVAIDLCKTFELHDLKNQLMAQSA